MQILCATDFSEPASRAADVAAALARSFRLPQRLVHCVSDRPLFAEPMLMLNNSLSAAWQPHLEKEAARLQRDGVAVVTEFRRGEACHELIAAATQHPVKLNVTGATGSGLAERWLLDRVAERVAKSAPVPVLVVRKPPALDSWLTGEEPLRVLCPVDLHHPGDAPLQMVKELRSHGAVEMETVQLRERNTVCREACGLFMQRRESLRSNPNPVWCTK